MLRPLVLAWIELKRFGADRGALAFGIALPIALFALMYGVFGQGASFSATASIVDLDGGPVAAQLIDRVSAFDGLEVEMLTEADADEALDRSRILTAVFIPAGFSERLEAGEPASVLFKRRGSGGDTGQIVSQIVQGVAQDVAAEFEIREFVRSRLDGSGVPEAQIVATVGTLIERAAVVSPIGVEIRAVGEEENALDRLIPGVLTMFLMFAATISAASIIVERNAGTLERLLTTRLSVNQLFAGKFLASVGRAMVQALILLSLAFAILRVGDAATFARVVAFSLLIAAAVSSLGLVVAGMARTQEQATWGSVFLTMTLTVFSGTFISVGETGVLAFLSRLTLNKYAIDAIGDMLTGSGGLAGQGPEAAILGGIAVVGFVVARVAFRTA
ncbi:MAG: ABC transporter permease [bacterium]|nr:ABC transporter permease [bacterium]